MNKYHATGIAFAVGGYAGGAYASMNNVPQGATAPLWAAVIGGALIGVSSKQKWKDIGKGLLIGTGLSLATHLTVAVSTVPIMYRLK